MDTEAAKKRSVNGKIETHYKGILLRGMVTSFNKQKGYGFIHCSDAKDRFFHIRDVASNLQIERGTTVNFIGIRTKKGRQAIELVPAESRHKMPLWDHLRLGFGHWGGFVSKFEAKLREEKRLAKENSKVKHIDDKDTSHNPYENDSWYDPISHNSFDFNEMDNPSLAFQRDTYENPM